MTTIRLLAVEDLPPELDDAVVQLARVGQDRRAVDAEVRIPGPAVP